MKGTRTEEVLSFVALISKYDVFVLQFCTLVVQLDTMQRDNRKPDPARPRPSSTVSCGGETRQVRKVNTKRVPYRVGYSWNKGGRLKELRIRHLARKFLKIWMQNTFGRILPHKAKSHRNRVVLRRAFEGWRDEWWTSRREWSLTMRAECHHRYYLCSLAFHSWRTFMSLQREKKCKIQNAQSFADRQRMRLVWDRWEVFTEMRRMKSRMLESALELNRLTTLHSAWSLWQTRLQQCHDFHALEDKALKHRALTLQCRTWRQWKERHTAACCQKEKESKAALHFVCRLKRKTLHRWKSYVPRLQTKRRSQAVAQHAYHLHLVMTCWSKWGSALHRKRSEEERLQAAGRLATQSRQRRALDRWRAYVTLCRDEAERDRIASQHHHHHLLRVGLGGLYLNVIRNKTYRLNNNMAVQHHHQTTMSRYLKLWQDRLEEAEDESFQHLTESALTKHSTSLLSSCFHHWRKKLADRRHMQELEHRADIWFAEYALPRCFSSWVDFTLRKRRHKHRRHKAQVYNQQRLYSLAFYTWWGQSEKHREQMLSERMAILHEERCRLQRAWGRWRQRTDQRIDEEEKRMASDRLYQRRLLHGTLAQWKDNSADIRDRRNREQQACLRGDLRCMRRAVEKWKQFVQSQRVKKSRLERMQHYHEFKLLKQSFVAWKTHHLQMSQIHGRAEDLYRQQELSFLRNRLSVWRENAVLLTEVRLMEQQAQTHFQHVLRLKVFLAWRDATTCALSKRHQQGEAVIRAQRSINQVRLLRSLRRWRKRTSEARRERMCLEKARRHHESKLLSKALKAWNEHHNQFQRNKVLKRQGVFLLRLKMYQAYFEQWKVKLQHRRREAKQTERALWHWSLTLQAKVLHGWRLCVTEQRRKQEQAVRAAQVYRDQLLREGVTRILTYAAHMNDLTTCLTQHSQEQRSSHLQRVVKRCALRWKQRALCKPGREQEVKGQPPKKSVTFCLTTPEVRSFSPSDAAEREDGDGARVKLPLSRPPRRQPRRREDLLETPLEINIIGDETAPKPSQISCHPVSSCFQSAKVPVTDCQTSTHDILLPPSAFMTPDTKDKLGRTHSSCSGDVPPGPPFKQPASVYQERGARLKASSGETVDAETDPTFGLTRELLSIQLDMKTYHQDRKQLRAWQKLKDVLQSWLHTSGRDEEMEKNAVCQELKELEERISRLSTELAQRKPKMLLHVERIQHLQTVLRDCSVFTTRQEMVLARSKSDDTH